MFRKLPILLAVLFPLGAEAQCPVNPDYDLLQATSKFGEVFVAPGQTTCEYVEVWGLYEGYTYPSRDSGVGFTVVPVEARYSSREDFERTFWSAHPRGTIVEVHNVEHSAACR